VLPVVAPPPGPARFASLKKALEPTSTPRGATLTASSDAPVTPDAVAAEAARVVGQVVVDRASAAVLEDARTLLRKLLVCDDAQKTHFAATCTALKSLRIQDLSVSAHALIDALLTDTIALGFHDSKLSALPADQQSALACGESLISTQLVPEITRTLLGRPQSKASLIVTRVVARAHNASAAPAGAALDSCVKAFGNFSAEANLAPGPAAVSAAVGGYLLCDPAVSVAKCPIEEHVNTVATSLAATVPVLSREDVVTAATSLALSFRDALTSADAQGHPDTRARLSHAIDVGFDVACLTAFPGSVANAAEVFGCDSKLHDPPASTAQYVSDAHYALNGAIDGNPNAIVAGLSSMITEDDARKGLRLVAALLRYVGTYTEQDASSQRVKILEDLSSEITDRTSRDGNVVFSVGGSLRAAAGGRWDLSGGKSAFFGPISLPIGFGMDVVGGVGFHAELGIVDLGQYLSYQQSSNGVVQVRSPSVADALAPSATVAVAFGRSVPFFVGGTFAYSPEVSIDTTGANKSGSVSVGLVVGAYVPIIDLN